MKNKTASISRRGGPFSPGLLSALALGSFSAFTICGQTTNPPAGEAPPPASAPAVPIPALGTEPAVPSYVPTVVADLLPVRDTNAAIGIMYPSGSADFVYLVAGMPRRSDPRLPPEAFRDQSPALTPPPAPIYLGPSADMYERVESGSSKAAITRKTTDDLIYSFPPGAVVRGAAPAPVAPAPRAVVPQPVTRSSAQPSVRPNAANSSSVKK